MSLTQESTDRHPPIAFIICGLVREDEVTENDGFLDWATDYFFVDNDFP